MTLLLTDVPTSKVLASPDLHRSAEEALQRAGEDQGRSQRGSLGVSPVVMGYRWLVTRRHRYEALIISGITSGITSITNTCGVYIMVIHGE